MIDTWVNETLVIVASTNASSETKTSENATLVIKMSANQPEQPPSMAIRKTLKTVSKPDVTTLPTPRFLGQVTLLD